MVITKHIPNTNGKNKSIRYVQIDMVDNENKNVFGYSLDNDLKIIGRIVVNNVDIDEYAHLMPLLSKGCNLFDVYQNNIHII